MGINFNIPGSGDKKSSENINNNENDKNFSVPQKPENNNTNKNNNIKKIEIKHKQLSGNINQTDYTRQGITLFIFGILSFIFYFSYNYVKLYDTISNKLPNQNIITEYEGYEKQLNNIFHIYNIEQYENLPTKGDNILNTINQIIGANDITYIHKRKLLTKIFNNITNETISLKKGIENTKSNITKYGFSPKEINKLLGGDEKDNISLQRSLLSLEVIKFSTAMKVFGLLYTFLEQFSNYYNIDVDLLRKKMMFYSSRAEIDIERYLQDCYLNPFEDLKKCSFIGDFDNYYTFFEPKTDIKPGLFKELMNFIDQKLTETSFPSLSITFNQFNPQSKNISFKVSVNTFQNDEKELINQGIISPHIFVITSIINLLKQSKFILGDSININNMKIETNTIEIGGKEFTVHSSTRNFDLPIQPDIQTEIFDYTPDVLQYDIKLIKDKTNIDLNRYGSENKSMK